MLTLAHDFTGFNLSSLRHLKPPGLPAAPHCRKVDEKDLQYATGMGLGILAEVSGVGLRILAPCDVIWWSSHPLLQIFHDVHVILLGQGHFNNVHEQRLVVPSRNTEQPLPRT